MHFSLFSNLTRFVALTLLVSAPSVAFARTEKTLSFVKPLSNYLKTQVPGKKTVCTVTINSSDEKTEFLKALPKAGFDFVELTPPASVDPSVKLNENWFDEACNTGVSCDLLIISGHFGGTFFGASGYKLSLEHLERQACSTTCPGILNSPKEVFLFGCNTLAGKEKDNRTKEEYINVLTAHGLSSNRAAEVAEARYGDFGFDNQSKMRKIFANVPRIYGFNSRGPTGPQIRSRVHEYITRIGNYAHHLDLLSNSVTGFQYVNHTLSNTLQDQSFTQCSGLTPSDPGYQRALEICRLFNKNIPLEKRIEQARALINSPDQFAVLPDLIQFLEINEAAAGISILKVEVFLNTRIRDKIVNIVKHISSPELSAYWLKIAYKIGWFTKLETEKILNEQILANLLRSPISEHHADFYCSLSWSEVWTSNFGNLFHRLLSQQTFDSRNGELALGCVDRYFSEDQDPTHLRTFTLAIEVIEAWKTKSPLAIYNAQWIISGHLPEASEATLNPVLNEYLDIAQHSSSYLNIAYAISTLLQKNHPQVKSLFPRLISLMPKSLLAIHEDYALDSLQEFFDAARKLRTPELILIAKRYEAELVTHPSLINADGKFQELYSFLRQITGDEALQLD